MENTKTIAKSIEKYLPTTGPVVVYGAPGAGKTTLVKALLDGLEGGQKPLVFDPWDGNTLTAKTASDELKDRPVLLVTDQDYTGPWTSVQVVRDVDGLGCYVRIKV